MDIFRAVPGWMLALVGVALAIELGLLVWALIDLLKRSEERVAGGRKWVWILVVLLVNGIGPIVYLAAGRKAAPVHDTSTDERRIGDRAKAAADALYGPVKEASDADGRE